MDEGGILVTSVLIIISRVLPWASTSWKKNDPLNELWFPVLIDSLIDHLLPFCWQRTERLAFVQSANTFFLQGPGSSWPHKISTPKCQNFWMASTELRKALHQAFVPQVFTDMPQNSWLKLEDQDQDNEVHTWWLPVSHTLHVCGSIVH